MLINCWPHFRNKSNGEGIFTFYSENAQNILKDVKCAKSPKKKTVSGDGGSSKESSLLRNPLTYLFKRETLQSGKTDKGENSSKQEKGRRKVLEKSVSMMEEFGRQEKISRQQKKELIKELKSSKLGTKSSSLTRTRTQPNMSPRHLDTSYYSCDEMRATPSPPPYPSQHQAPTSHPTLPTPPDNNMKEILSSGHYYSFDKV